ncbi:acyloxyacyl hydrolase [Microvirga pudoricolor]|uniref:acyloxyacyl hydrolase n=1 Tax=Microvirga pudoricolor TaxID=2778729 RepID=UPI00195031A5|nr:acyloxyacyl hydrolase [Microvirga pudoricolor]MBM6595484.1 acyloxyacyl hydrolase [Microvirga pudoricolor]
MRASWIAGLSLLIASIGATAAFSADYKQQPTPYIDTAPLNQPRSFVSELRFGLSAQDPWGNEGRGTSANLTGEILFAKPFTASDLFTSYFIPRPHLGGSINTGGHTSFAYAGLTWTFDVTPSVFLEGSLGGAVHNGDTHANPGLVAADKQALGCSPLFRESASVGVRLSANWSVMATIEHLSNAGLCTQNRGLTNVGARVGYSF